MNSYRRNDGRSVRLLLIATGIVVLIFVLDLVSGGFIRGFLRGTSTLVWSAGSGLVHGIPGNGFFSSRATLLRENEALRQEVARLQTRSAETAVLKEELGALRRLVHLAERAPGISAAIVSSLASSPYGTFVIGVGSGEGIAVGDLVLSSEEGVVVGRISETNEHRALVTELFAPDARIEGIVRGASFELEGRGGGNARAELPSNVEVEIGDVVTSPLVGGKAIGIVGALRADSGGAYQTVFIRVPGLSELRFVYVVSS